MMDLFDLPGPFTPGDNVQMFMSPSGVWLKPRGVTMMSILCIGGGGGGGGGLAAASGGRGGGGGGGSSGVARVVVPAWAMPDRLFVNVGVGGIGGGSGVAGTPGLTSNVSISVNLVGSNLVAVSGAGAAGGGAAGTGAAGGAGGIAATIAVLIGMALASIGTFLSIAGQAGAIGGDDVGAVGGAISLPTGSTTGLVTQGGSGGAGTTSADFAGGAHNPTIGSYISDQRPATPAAGSNNGSGGPQLWKPFFGFGGGGGSSASAAPGGNGGNGAYGSGGGGGGGGTAGGGQGGDGGSGIVIITCW